jgi:hypothetical protein
MSGSRSKDLALNSVSLTNLFGGTYLRKAMNSMG